MREEIIVAVVVSYEPHLKSLVSNLAAIVPQVDKVVIVDNGSKNQAHLVQTLKRIASPKLGLRCLQENQGIGAAHNHGISIAKELKADYVLLLDQDSQPHPDMVEKLYDAVLQLKSSGEFDSLAALGPRYLSANGSDSFFVKFGLFKFQRTYCHSCEHGIVSADFLISSGSLIPMPAIESVGEMDAELFIDHVDTEWFLRAQSKGMQSFGVCGSVMEHGLGENMRKLKFFGIGRERNVPQHKPFRYYYMFRNSIVLYRRNYASKQWKWNDLQRLLQIFIFYGLCFGPRWKNLKMMFRGVRDGLRNNLGKLPE